MINQFGADTYMPVIRFKTGEQRAIVSLATEVRKSIVPLFEFVPKELQGDFLTKTRRHARNLRNFWGPSSSAFVDFGLLPPAKRLAMPQYFFAETSRMDLTQLGIVVNLHEPQDVVAMAAEVRLKHNLGLAVRIPVAALRQRGFSEDLGLLLERLKTSPEHIHLLLDFKYLHRDSPALDSVLHVTPQISDWKTVTVLAGTFPPDLTDLKKNLNHDLPRTEFKRWADHVERGYGRLPSFGDYMTLHPIFHDRENEPCRPSASIRYTTSAGFLVFRGEVPKKDGPGWEQYKGECQILMDTDHYSGRTFSDGDAYFAELAESEHKTGNPKTILTASVNHHLVLLANQIKSVAKDAASQHIER